MDHSIFYKQLYIFYKNSDDFDSNQVEMPHCAVVARKGALHQSSGKNDALYKLA